MDQYFPKQFAYLPALRMTSGGGPVQAGLLVKSF